MGSLANIQRYVMIHEIIYATDVGLCICKYVMRLDKNKTLKISIMLLHELLGYHAGYVKSIYNLIGILMK